MYCAYWNLSVCVICAWGVPESYHKWLESLCLIGSLEIHLSTYENLDLAPMSSNLL